LRFAKAKPQCDERKKTHAATILGLKNIFSSNKFGEQMAILIQLRPFGQEKMTMTMLLFLEKRLFSQKLAQIAENIDHNVDPRTI
jgi:hypothetical protein